MKKPKREQTKSLINFKQPPNTEEFMEELRVLSSAAVGVVAIRTKEFYRAVSSLFEFTVAKGDTSFWVWSVAEGWKNLPTSARLTNEGVDVDATLYPLNNDEIIPEPPTTVNNDTYVFDLYPDNVNGDGVRDISKALSSLIKRMTDEPLLHSVNVMFAPEFWFEDPGFQEFIRMFINKAFDVDARLMLICHDGMEVPERLFEEVRVIDFLPPNAGELYEFCEETLQGLDFGEADIEIELSNADKERIVQNALGMSYNEFTTALSIGIVKQDETLKEGDPIDIEALVGTIRETKVELIKKSQVLEMLSPISIDQVGGMGNLKKWLELRKKAFTPAAREYGVDMPKGILAVGVPGGGKSLVARAIAHVLGLPLISFDVGKVFGGLVGQSESQMRSALKTIDALAPAIVLLDEVDKMFANTSGGGDSGTSARVFGTFLTWLQERKNEEKPVFVVMTANNVEGLPPELLRKGRLDEIFSVGFPQAQERMDILRIHLKKRGHVDDIEDFVPIVEATSQFVGAELEGIVKDALLIAFNQGEPIVSTELLVEVANKVKPLSKTFKDRVEAMNRWATENAVPSSDYGHDGKGSVVSSNKSGFRTTKVRKSAKRIIRPSKRTTDD